MANWDAAVTAMVGVSALGMLAADAEKRRAGWVRALRRALARMADLIRFEQPELCALLRRVELRATPQERALTRALHACADRLTGGAPTRLAALFEAELARACSSATPRGEDAEAFIAALAELGTVGLDEQLRLIGDADERLRRRETALLAETARRAQLIRALSLACGAAAFLILV